MWSRITNKKYVVDSSIEFPETRLYSLWSAQRPPASIGVKIQLWNGGLDGLIIGEMAVTGEGLL